MNKSDIITPAHTGHKVTSVRAIPISSPVENGPILGIGQLKKRESVVVRIETEDGTVGWGEAHHGRAATSVASLINETLKWFVLDREATDNVGIWDAIYRMQLRSHGMGAGAAIGLSGIDMALWDIRGKLTGWPLYKLLGGSAKAIPAYAGGVSLGWQEPATLIDEVQACLNDNYRAVKLRVGDTATRDIERVTAVRRAVGDDVAIMLDVNTNYDLGTAMQVAPAFAELGVAWLEEPFSPHDHKNYTQLARHCGVPLAAGENHYTKFEFSRVIEDGVVSILQPDVSKTGGITEVMRIAAMGAAWGRTMCPHTSTTGLNMAASVHVLAAVERPGYFEGDVSHENPFRDQLTSTPYTVDSAGNVHPSQAPGLGVELDEDFLKSIPATEGFSYA